jgi:arsenite-transporting ATPase
MHAAELDADGALSRWMRARAGAFRTIAERGTYLDREDVDRLMGLSLPGVDELVGLLELRRISGGGTWDTVVVDTAPTGHTLRLLETPEVLGRIAEVLDAMQAKHRVLASTFAGAYGGDAADATIEEIARDGAELRDLLRDRTRCGITWDTLPEPMAVAESVRAVEALARRGVVVERLLVNRVTPRPERRCSACTPRVLVERAAIASAKKSLGGIPMATVSSAADEPRGVAALRRLGTSEAPRAASPRVEASRPRAEGSTRWPPSERLLLFGGKGGVGKTTCAAATAVALSRSRKKVLLLSTDPAHSVGDVLGASIGDEMRRVPGARGLHARELDADAAFAAERARYRDAVDDLFRALVRSPGIDVSYDRAVMEDLIDIAPPGIDEVFAVATLVEELHRDWDAIVVDTAPTGHTLRLLAMPHAAREWVHAILALLLKYERVLGLGELASDLLGFSRRLGALEEVLRDPKQTAFIPVTRAAELPRLETERLLRALSRARIPTGPLVVDAVTRGECARCRAAAAVEAAELAKLSPLARRRAVFLAPATYPPPLGAAPLARWARLWVPL